MPALSAAALGDVPTVVLVGGALLSGLYWITERRNQVAMAEGEKKAFTPKDTKLNHEGH